MTDTEPLPPGIYHDLSFEAYRPLPYLSQSILKMMDRDERFGMTPLHAKAAFDGHPIKARTSTLRLGTAEHCWIVEGEAEFRRRHKIATPCVGVVKSRPGEICGCAAKFVSIQPQHIEDQYRQAEHLLTSCGWTLRARSDSGSAYFQNGNRHLRVSDHPPNEKTQQWLDETRALQIVVGHGANIVADLNSSVPQTSSVEPLLFWYCGTHAKGLETDEPTDFVSTADLERIRAMAEGVRNHEACQFLKRSGWSEATIIYDVPVRVSFQTCRKCHGVDCLTRNEAMTEYRCRICGRKSEAPGLVDEVVNLRHKVRLDRLAGPLGEHPHLILDLKRMQVGEGALWIRERRIREYGWHVQAAMYTEAVRIHFGVPRCHWAWLFVEEKPPHDVCWLPASDAVLSIGTDQLNRYRSEWARCLLTGKWSGYCDGNQPPGGLPDGYVRDYFKRFAGENGELGPHAQAAAG
jgi:hypothetical protein